MPNSKTLKTEIVLSGQKNLTHITVGLIINLGENTHKFNYISINVSDLGCCHKSLLGCDKIHDP